MVGLGWGATVGEGPVHPRGTSALVVRFSWSSVGGVALDVVVVNSSSHNNAQWFKIWFFKIRGGEVPLL